MGSTANAFFGYGFVIKTDYDKEIDEKEIVGVFDFEDKYAIKKGLPDNPEDADVDVRVARLQKKDEIWKTSGITIEHSGYGDEDDQTDIVVMVSESAQEADWEGSTALDPMKFVVQPHWEATLRTYCETMGIEYREPKWLLSAFWF